MSSCDQLIVSHVSSDVDKKILEEKFARTCGPVSEFFFQDEFGF
jgi:hypothetical protein